MHEDMVGFIDVYWLADAIRRRQLVTRRHRRSFTIIGIRTDTRSTQELRPVRR